MNCVTLFTTNATLVYFGEPQPEVERQAQKLYQLAKNEVVNWIRGELLDACRKPGVIVQEASLYLPACNSPTQISISTHCSVDTLFSPNEDDDIWPMAPRPMFSGLSLSDDNYITPIGQLPYSLYIKMISEDTPVSKLFAFFSSEYQKLANEVKTAVPSKPDMDALFIHDVLSLYRFGGVIQAFEAMRR